jgi:hypothetical protein
MTSPQGTKRPRDEDEDDPREDTPIPKAKRYRKSTIRNLASSEWDDDSQVLFRKSYVYILKIVQLVFLTGIGAVWL